MRDHFRTGTTLVGLILLMACAAIALAQQPGDQAAPPDLARLYALKARLDKIEAQLPPEQRAGAGALADARLAIRKLRIVLATRPPWYLPARPTDEYFARAEEALAALENPAGAQQAPRTGLRERAYICEIDGSPEPFLLYVPTTYTTDREWPLLVFLHGYSPDLDVTNWTDLMYPTALQELCEREGFILLEPYGRSNTEFMGVGERDVLRTIQIVRNEYRIDPRRIIISGTSMGGSGAYAIACHYPDLFAGVVGFTGRVDFYEWMGVAKASLPKFKQVRMDCDYARELLGNLLHTSVLILHGADDAILPTAQSRLMHKLLRDLGHPCEYIELPDTAHFDLWRPQVMQHPKLVEMLRTARLPEAPRKVRFRTYSLKYNSCFWLRLEGMEDWSSPAELEAAIYDSGRVEISVKNVTGLMLHPTMPTVAGGQLRLFVNGREMNPPVWRSGQRRIRLQDGPDERQISKTPSLCGPIREAYSGPFVIVCPSMEGREAEADRETARRLMREWYEYAQGFAQAKLDADVTETDIREKNLVLCGSPATNRILAKIANKLPIRIEKDRYVVGAHTFPREGNGMQMIHPNPLNPSRYVLVVDGVPWGPQLQRNHKLDFLPDFIIYSSQTEPDGTIFPTNRYLCAGFFDGHWRLSKSSTWTSAPSAEKQW